MAVVGEKARVKRTVYVGGSFFGYSNNIGACGLAEEITERVLYSAFITFGEIVEVQIPRDPATRTVEFELPTPRAQVKTRGFGFVEFQDASDAADAVDNMDESEFYGRVLTVNFARPLQNKLGTTRPVWDDIDEYNKLKEQIVAGEIASDGPTRLAAAPDEDAAAEPDVDE